MTGWSIGSSEAGQSGSDLVTKQDAAELHEKLKDVIIPIFYRDRERWVDVMRHSIALNAPYFNTHRMVQQYVTNAYLF